MDFQMGCDGLKQIAVLGHGVVGSGVMEVLEQNREFLRAAIRTGAQG